MKSYGLTLEGQFKGQIVPTLPAWTAADEGREIYVQDEEKRYYGDGTSWVDYATVGVSGTSGSSGTSGISGTSGSSGTSGIDGTSGSSGTSGVSGTSGSSGSSGTSGYTLGRTYWLRDEAATDATGYESLEVTPGGGTEATDSAVVNSGSGQVLIDKYLTNPGVPNLGVIPGGSWVFTTYLSVSSTPGTTTVTIKVYEYVDDATSNLLFEATTADIEGITATRYDAETIQGDFSVDVNSRLAVEYYAQTTSAPDITVTLYYEGIEHYSRVATPLAIEAGVSGTSGSSGSSGSSGIDGTSGSSGTSGLSGTSGSSGTSGAAGTSGTSGNSGTSGSSGTSGATGAAGTSGTSGTSGGGGGAVFPPGDPGDIVVYDSDSTSPIASNFSILSDTFYNPGGVKFISDQADNWDTSISIGNVGTYTSGNEDPTVVIGHGAGNSGKVHNSVIVGNGAGTGWGNGSNTFIGHQCATVTGGNSYQNQSIGYQSGVISGSTTTQKSTFIGTWCGSYAGGSTESVHMGHLCSRRPSTYSVMVGSNVRGAITNATCDYSVAIGYKAGYTWGEADNNVAVGAYAGYSNNSGDANVFIGYKAGYNETGSNKLHIANNDTESLIEGDFSAKTITFNTDSTSSDAFVVTSGMTFDGDLSPDGGISTGYTGDLNDSTSTKIADVVNGIITAVYF